MQELYFTWHTAYLGLKILLVAVLQTFAIWEPSRWIILKMQKRWPGLQAVRKRIAWSSSLLIPYAFLVGFARIFLEDNTNIWNAPVFSFTTVIWATGVSLLFILLELAIYESIFFFREWDRAREEADQLRQANYQIQLDLLKLQIQPHFLFNTLNTLIGLVEENEPKKVIRYTEQIASVYRYLLLANDQPMVSLREEIKFVEAYLYLLKMRYPEGLFVEMDIEEAGYDFKIPPLSLQLLIENAVKHNIITRAKPLQIGVLFDRKQLSVCVTNNLQRRTDQSGTGKGLKHLQRKLELLGAPPLKISETNDAFVVKVPVLQG